MRHIERKIFLFLYRRGWYKALLIGDGWHDNRRAFQTRLDAGETWLMDGSMMRPGKYVIGGTIDIHSSPIPPMPPIIKCNLT